MAVDRLPGSTAVAEVEHLVAGELAALGYAIARHEFTTSSARLAAASLTGAGLGWTALALAPLLVFPAPGWLVSIVGLATLALVAVLAAGIAEGRLRARRVEPVPAVNLVATRDAPRAWLVAHLDAKAQGLSLGARVLAVLLAVAGAAGLVLLLVGRVGGTLPWGVVLPVAAAALAGGAVLSRSMPRPGSPGAVDNATGLIAVLVAARRLARRRDVGVLLTGAEEFGMEGARAWVRTSRAAGLFVNFDGVDARGAYRVMRHGGGVAGRPLADALADELRRTGSPVRVGPLPPGVLVDGTILARAGMAGVTVSRGDWRTLAIVHTPRDTADRVDVQAAVTAGAAAAAALEHVLG